VVLKALTIALSRHLPVSKRCVHVKGHGGAKAAVRQVWQALPKNLFVLRTDVKGYYACIDHFLLLDQLAVYIKERKIMNLLSQYLRRCVEWGCLYQDIEKGISRGCPLSPLMGVFFLKQLDDELEKSGLFYVRFMDDILVLAPTRWKLRGAVKTLNQVFNVLKLEQHPDKTFIGRIEKGFDSLGYLFHATALTVATKTIENFVTRYHRLYEQKKTAPDVEAVLGDYVQRWRRWVFAALRNEFKQSTLWICGDERAPALQALSP